MFARLFGLREAAACSERAARSQKNSLRVHGALRAISIDILRACDVHFCRRWQFTMHKSNALHLDSFTCVLAR